MLIVSDGRAAVFSADLWPYIYIIFVISLCAIAIGYWLIVRDEAKRRPIAKERIASLAKEVEGMAEYARPAFMEKLAVCEDLFQRKYYDRSLKLADRALGEARELNDIAHQVEVEMGSMASRLQKARELGLEIDEDAIGLTQLKRDLRIR